MPAGAHPWFTQLDAITAAREGDAVDESLNRACGPCPARDRTVFDSWALAWICPAPIVRIWIESRPPSRARKCLVSLATSRAPCPSARRCCAPRTATTGRCSAAARV